MTVPNKTEEKGRGGAVVARCHVARAGEAIAAHRPCVERGREGRTLPATSVRRGMPTTTAVAHVWVYCRRACPHVGGRGRGMRKHTIHVLAGDWWWDGGVDC